MPAEGERAKWSRKRRKGRPDVSKTKRGASDGSAHHAHDDDVLKQLERQRRKQAVARGSTLDDRTAPSQRQRANSEGPSKRLGRFEYCTECCSYFPRGEHLHERENMQHQRTAFEVDSSTPSRFLFPPFAELDLLSPGVEPPLYQRRMEGLRPFLDYSYMARSCVGAHLRFRRELIEQWRFQMLARSMCIASPLILPKWVDNSRPSCRTFDCLGQSAPPSIVANLWSEDLFLTNFKTHTILKDGLFPTAHTVRQIKDPRGLSEQDVCCYGRIASNLQSGETLLEWTRLHPVDDESFPGAMQSERVAVDFRWSDFCSSRDGKRLIIVGEPWKRESCVWHFALERNTEPFRHGRIRRFPLSDALCVEPIDDHSFGIGHLNGILSLWDDRIPGESSTASTHLRSVLRIRHVEPCQILVRGGGCTSPSAGQPLESMCQLWDVRSLKNMVHNFSLPLNREGVRHQHSRMATYRSNGVVSDPTRTIVLAPWVRQVDNRQTPQLGVWSLTSGKYLGSRELAMSNTSPNEQIIVELTDSITEGWQFSAEGEANGSLAVSLAPGSFGLWYRISAGGMSCSSIHHVALEGRLD